MKDINNYLGYKITKNGDVYSFKKKGGNGRLSKKGFLLCTTETKGGYLLVELHQNGISRKFTVHSLVLETFQCKRPSGMVARHLDGNPKNNNILNLRWGTLDQNIEDFMLHGKTIGENNPNAKISNEVALRIIEIRNREHLSYAKIGKKFNVSSQCIYRICKNLTKRFNMDGRNQ